MTCMLLLCCMLYVRVKWKGPAWISHVHPWCFSGATLASWNSAPPTEAVEATTRPLQMWNLASINPHPFGSILFFCLKNEGSRPELFAMLIAMSVELVAVVSLRLGKSSSVCMKVFTFLSKACKTGSSSSNMQTLAFLCSTKVSTSAMAYIGQ